ncbi:MAG: Asp-tRNA(Asn)/Glu-tRNA(Gln) amidotransferase subunit GatC [Oscillospiraceae bacterium]
MVLNMDMEMIGYLSELSKLNFTGEELEKAAHDMTDIINLMDTIKEIDITYDPYLDNKNVYLNDLRKDISAPSMPTQRVLSNAVNSESCFVVPKVVE